MHQIAMLVVASGFAVVPPIAEAQVIRITADPVTPAVSVGTPVTVNYTLRISNPALAFRAVQGADFRTSLTGPGALPFTLTPASTWDIFTFNPLTGAVTVFELAGLGLIDATGTLNVVLGSAQVSTLGLGQIQVNVSNVVASINFAPAFGTGESGVIDVVPAPGAAAMLGLGGMLVARRRR